MNCWIAFGIGLVIGLLPLIYGIFRAMKMLGGDIGNFNWNDARNAPIDNDLNTEPNKEVKDITEDEGVNTDVKQEPEY